MLEAALLLERWLLDHDIDIDRMEITISLPHREADKIRGAIGKELACHAGHPIAVPLEPDHLLTVNGMNYRIKEC